MGEKVISNPGKHPRHPHIPLRGHRNGKWYIKSKGRFYYFSTWDNPDGAAAEYEAAKKFVERGMPIGVIVPPPDVILLDEVVDRFLTFQESRVSGKVDATTFDDVGGEISDDQFEDYKRTLLRFLGEVGSGHLANSFPVERLIHYRQSLINAGLRGRTINRHLTWVTAMFRWAKETAKLITTDYTHEPALRKIAAKKIRREQRIHEESNGTPTLTRRQFRELLALAKHGSALKAAMLLAANCGYGQKDLGKLRISRINLRKRYINYQRPKVEIRRQAVLWPETVEAIEAYLKRRPKPLDPRHDDLLFITRWGRPFWYQIRKTNDDGTLEKLVKVDSFRLEFGKLLKKAKIKTKAGERKGLGWYALRRLFATWADLFRDRNVRLRYMGQQLQGMDPHYVRLMPWKRLARLARFLRHKILIVKLKERGRAETASAIETTSSALEESSRSAAA